MRSQLEDHEDVRSGCHGQAATLRCSATDKADFGHLDLPNQLIAAT